MNTTTILTRLALAGIASGMLAVTACDKEGKAGNGSGSTAAKMDSVKTDPVKTDPVKTAEHACKGLNACKGQGGCSVSETDLKAYAAKAGIPMENAGKAHGCKGRNECKGLGGCRH